MQRPLPDQVIVVTGASSGIGLATARTLARRGARVVLTARDADALARVAADIEAEGGIALAVAADVTDEAALGEVARRTVERFGRIDTWVNMAAVFIQGTVADITLDEFRRVIDVDLIGYINGTRHALAQMERQGNQGQIVMVSSILAHRAAAYFSAYAAAKAGIDAFSESLRAELWDSRIHVSTIYLPPIDSPIYRHARGKFGTVPKPPPLIATPEEAADLIARRIERPRSSSTLGPMGLFFGMISMLPHPIVDYLFHRVDELTLTDQRDRGDNLDRPLRGPPRARDGWMRHGWRGLRITEVARVFRRELAVGGVLLAGAAWAAARRWPRTGAPSAR